MHSDENTGLGEVRVGDRVTCLGGVPLPTLVMKGLTKVREMQVKVVMSHTLQCRMSS